MFQVKSQISTVFGRQLECLRSRELWLQGQVELVEQAKEAVLRRQQDRLCRVLGGLSTSLAYSQEEEGEVKLDRKLSESIERSVHIQYFILYSRNPYKDWN